MKNPLLFCICLFLAVPCSARIITVSTSGAGGFATIQAAIDDSNDGDIVIVQPGVYTGEGNRDIDFTGKAVTVRSTDPNDPDIVAATIIDCEGAGRGFDLDIWRAGEWVLEGLTITNGHGEDGGAIFCYTKWPYRANPTIGIIRNCLITRNSASKSGGGIYCAYDSPELRTPTINNCTITGNSAGDMGGGVAGCVLIKNCTITGNTSCQSGGGLVSCWEVANCKISGNSTDTSGGGLCGCDKVTHSTITGNSAGEYGGGLSGCHGVTNCMITGNSAGEDGGGLSGCSTVTNCTVTSNSAGGYGGGLYECRRITNCIIWGNTDSSGTIETAQISYQYQWMIDRVVFSCIQDDNPNDDYIPFNDEEDANNIDDYPLFMRDPDDGGDGWGDNPDTPDIDEGANDDFGDVHLQRSSPCINTGDLYTWIGPDGVDMDGEPRLMGGIVDMGADEFFIPAITVTKPHAGEVWVAGSQHQIEWSSYGVGMVDILFSTYVGGNWQVIESAQSNTGNYIWSLPQAVDCNRCVVSLVPSVPDANVVTTESGVFTIHPDFHHPAVPAKWKSLGGDFRRTGLSTDNGPELGCVKWKFETKSAVSASVTVGAGGRVHIACEDGKVYTLDADDGSTLWTYDANSPLLTAPTVGPDGSTYVGSEDGKLYAISIAGNVRWTHTTDGPISSSPAVSPDGKVYAGSQDGSLYALGSDGSELWSFETKGPGVVSAGAILASPAIADDGSIYVAGLYDPNLYALDPNNGSVKWVCNFEFADPCDPNNMTSGWPFASPVVGEDGTIYQMLLYDPNLYAIEPENGTIIWSTNLSDPCSGWFEPYYYVDDEQHENPLYHLSDLGLSEPALGPEGTIYVNLDDPYLRAVDPNGSIKWVRRLGMTGGFTLTIGSNGLIYAASDDGYLCVVDPEGEEIARLQSEDWLNFPVIAADGTILISDSEDDSLFITDANNTVWAVGTDGCDDKELVLHRPYDLNADHAVNFIDFAVFAADWLSCTDEGCGPEIDQLHLTGDVDRDLYVDFADLAALANQWLSED